MTKDVIYIDVEDDITTIVGKIKSSKEKIIALVPPNRTGVLQSAVSMRLLQRAAEQQKKRLVLISNNSSLSALAAAAHIPVAKNLQSKPELAEVPVLKVDDDEVIDGEMLPVGELAKTANKSGSDKAVASAIAASTVETKSVEKVKKSKVKVPDFSTFRKKLLLIGGLVVAFIFFLIWAIWFAPRATVVISAKTTSSTVSKMANLTLDGKTDVNTNTLKAFRQEQKRDFSVEFTPTGKKKVGEKASGTARFRTDAATILLYGLTVPSGTQIASSSGAVYITTQSANFPKGDGSTLGGVDVTVVAKEVGEEYNGASGSATTSAQGVSSVSFVKSPSGGTSREVTVVSADDVQKASDKLGEQKDDTLKNKLKEAFGSSAVVIEESFKEHRSDPTPSVGVDSEASGPVTLKTTLTATMLAVDSVDLSALLDHSINTEISGKNNQKIYDNGSKQVKFSQFSDADDKNVVRISANGVIGPTIDEAKVKELAKGRSYGDIQSNLESIDGVDNVDTKFWPFWVRTVPNDVNRITVEFKLKNAG